MSLQERREDSYIVRMLEEQREQDPGGFSKLLSNLDRIQEGVRSTEKLYPKTRHVFDGVDAEENTDLGNALTVLSSTPCGIELYSTSTPTTYDFTGLEDDRLDRVMRHLEGYRIQWEADKLYTK